MIKMELNYYSKIKINEKNQFVKYFFKFVQCSSKDFSGNPPGVSRNGHSHYLKLNKGYRVWDFFLPPGEGSAVSGCGTRLVRRG
jgi:hypothetical protein